METKSFRSLKRGLWIKKQYDGFTLIELIVVVTIISMIGIVSISGFFRMTQTQDMETLTKIISQTIDSFDQDIMYHRAVSYETVFQTGSLGFTTSIDGYKKRIPIAYSFDFITGSGSVQTLGSGTGIIQLYLHSHDSVGDTLQLPENGATQSFSFPDGIQKRWYQIVARMNDSDLLTYDIQYYNLLNPENKSENEARLMSIIGGDGISYPSLIVRNTLGKKSLFASGSVLRPLSQATLVFEKNGQERELVMESGK